jgi:hypothetical protein
MTQGQHSSGSTPYYYTSNVTGGYINLSTQKYPAAAASSTTTLANVTTRSNSVVGAAAAAAAAAAEGQRNNSPLNLEQRSSPLNLTAVQGVFAGGGQRQQQQQQQFYDGSADYAAYNYTNGAAAATGAVPYNQENFDSNNFVSFGYGNYVDFSQQQPQQQPHHHQQQQQHQQQQSAVAASSKIRLFCSTCSQGKNAPNSVLTFNFICNSQMSASFNFPIHFC